MPLTIQHSLTMTAADDTNYENRPSHWNQSHKITANLSASEVKVQSIEGATYEDLQEIHNTTRSAGHIDGGDISDAGGGDIDVSAGQGFIRGVDDDVSTLYAFNWPAPSSLSIPSDSIRYVRVDYNAGSPIVTVSASEDYDYRTGFPLGFVVNEGGTLYINNTPHSTGRVAGRISRRNYEVDGRSRAHALGGLIISESASAKTMAMTAGVTWLRGIREIVAAFDSNGSDTFDRYYRDGGSGFTKEAAQTVVPDGLYDDNSGTPATIGNNNYANYWFYIGPTSAFAMVYGRGDFNSLAQAQAEAPPSSLPLRLQVGSLLLGRFILRRTGGSSYNVVLVESAFTNEFISTPVSDHGSLSGLGDDDHPQYHLTSLGVIRQISAGTQAVTSGSLSFADSNGVTFGINNGTLTATVAAGGGGLTNIRVSAGTTSNLLSDITFDNANGITFGLDASTITASHNGLTSQSNQAVSGQNGSFTFQTVSFSNANGMSFGTSAGPALTASYTRPVVSNAIQAVGSATGSGTNTSRFAADDHVHLGVFSAGVSNVGNTAGNTAVRPGQWVFAGSNALTVSQQTAANSLQTLHIQGPLSATTISSVTSVNVIGTRGSRFALEDHQHAGLYQISVGGNTAGGNTSAGPGSFMLAGGPNITLSGSTAAGGMTLSVSGNNPGAAAEANWHTLAGNVVGNSSASGSTILLSGGPNITLSGLNGSQIVISAAAGGGGGTVDRYLRMPLLTQAGATFHQSSVSIFPFNLGGALACSNIRFAMSIGPQTQTNTSSAGHVFSFSMVLYTRNVSTLSSLRSGSQTYSSFYQSNSTASYGGARGFTIDFDAATTLVPDEYWLALHVATTTALQTSRSLAISMGVLPALATAMAGLDPFYAATTNTRGAMVGLGIFSTQATRATIAFSALTGQTGNNASLANLWCDIRNWSIW